MEATDPYDTNEIGHTLGRKDTHSIFKPRLMPIRSIPWVAFRHLPSDAAINAEYLGDIWDFTFDHVRAHIIGPLPDNPELQYLFQLKGLDNKMRDAQHKRLLQHWSPNLS